MVFIQDSSLRTLTSGDYESVGFGIIIHCYALIFYIYGGSIELLGTPNHYWIGDFMSLLGSQFNVQSGVVFTYQIAIFFEIDYMIEEHQLKYV